MQTVYVVLFDGNEIEVYNSFEHALSRAEQIQANEEFVTTNVIRREVIY